MTNTKRPLKIFVLLLLTATAQAKTSVSVVPSKSYPTIQSAVDSYTRTGTISLRAGTYNEQVVINNKTITIIGQDQATTKIENIRFAESTFQVLGDANLVLKNLQIQGGSNGILISERNGFKPRVSLDRVSILSMERGITGTPNTLELLRSSISANSIGGIILVNPNHVSIDTSLIYNNLGTGLQISGSGSGATPTVYVTNTRVDGNEENGISIQHSRAEVYLTQIDLNQNRGSHLLLNNASNVSLLKSNLYNSIANLSGMGDGIRVFHSRLLLDHNRILLSEKAGLAVYGCPKEAISQVIVQNTHTFNSGTVNWISGSMAFCSSPKPTNWIQQLNGNLCGSEAKPGTCEPEFNVISGLGAP